MVLPDYDSSCQREKSEQVLIFFLGVEFANPVVYVETTVNNRNLEIVREEPGKGWKLVFQYSGNKRKI